jgi:hypothetical protein
MPHAGGHPSSLIQVVKFSERFSIVPYEILKGLNVDARTLSLIFYNLHLVVKTAYANTQD